MPRTDEEIGAEAASVERVHCALKKVLARYEEIHRADEEQLQRLAYGLGIKMADTPDMSAEERRLACAAIKTAQAVEASSAKAVAILATNIDTILKAIKAV